MANSVATLPYPDEQTLKLYEASMDTFAVGVKDADYGPTTLHAIRAQVASGSDYLIMYDDINPSLGTTVPDFQFPTGVETQLYLGGEGAQFLNGLSFTVANVGGTVCSGNPTATNTIGLLVED